MIRHLSPRDVARIVVSTLGAMIVIGLYVVLPLVLSFSSFVGSPVLSLVLAIAVLVPAWLVILRILRKTAPESRLRRVYVPDESARRCGFPPLA